MIQPHELREGLFIILVTQEYKKNMLCLDICGHALCFVIYVMTSSSRSVTIKSSSLKHLETQCHWVSLLVPIPIILMSAINAYLSLNSPATAEFLTEIGFSHNKSVIFNNNLYESLKSFGLLMIRKRFLKNLNNKMEEFGLAKLRVPKRP